MQKKDIEKTNRNDREKKLTQPSQIKTWEHFKNINKDKKLDVDKVWL